jgi:stage II sporulation protein P
MTRGRPIRPTLLMRLSRLLVAILMISVALTLSAGRAQAGEELGGVRYMSVSDGDGNPICETGFRLGVGDEYVDENNGLWRVERIVGDTAVVSFVRRLDLTSAADDFRAAWAASALAAPGSSPQVGIYHTHSDESYQPSDGTDSDPSGQGGVCRVGQALAWGLRDQGLVVNHSLASHLPHDAGAYERSRRTALSVLRGSAAIFDVHRDAAPAEAYARRVGGQSITQIMMVIGTGNPQAEANFGFAAALKAASDEARPGLIRGILKTSGDFNQDLSSRALLLEVGANTNRRDEAEAAVARLAAVVPSLLGGGAGGSQSTGAWRAIGIISVLVVAGGGLWLFVATGGNWREAWRKLRSLGEEFASYLGRRRPRPRS